MGAINWGALNNSPAPAQTGAINWGALQNTPQSVQQSTPSTNQVQATPSNSAGGYVGNFIDALGHHVMNPLHGAAQFVENTVAKGASYLPDNPISRAIIDTAASDNAAMKAREASYQKAVPNNPASYAGATVGEALPFAVGGGARAVQAAGNKVAPMVAALLGRKAGMAAGGAAQGALAAAVQPVTNGDYWAGKGNQLETGAAFGAAAPAIVSGLAKVIKPNPSAAYTTLADAGVTPTLGQRLGGMANTIEEKAQSLPFVGDVISQARNRSLQSFNKATLNDVVKPIGETVSTVGHDGVAEAGNKLSSAYNNVLSNIKGVNFDDSFNGDFGQLRDMAKNLTPDMANRFESVVTNKFLSRVSPANGMDATTLKTASSDISALARKYSASSVASEQELGGALTQLDSLINQQVQRSNPQFAPTLNAIDQGWAKLVRVEQAAKSAAGNKVNTGVFTPSQLMQAVRSTDQSVRGRAVARGDALMQDWAQSGLKVLGDKVPNSGTFDRAANGAALAALLTHPEYGIPAAIASGIGSIPYTSAGQKAAVALATKRPAAAQGLADAVLRYLPTP